MSDTQSTTPPVEEPPAQEQASTTELTDEQKAEAEATATAEAEAKAKAEAEDEGKTFDKAYVTKLREESASWRTQLRETQEKFANAKTPEEIAEITKSSEETIARLEREILVRDAASDHELPKELAALLQGNTAEELAAHAKVLQKFAPAPAPASLGGGLDPDDGDDGEMDPRKLARRTRRS